MEQILVTAGLGFLGNSLIALGQVIQKMQVQSFDLKDAAAKKARRIGMWILGILGSNAGLALLYWAVSIGSASIVGAMNGSGLAALIILSRIMLGERIDRWEMLGIGLIIAGVVLFPLAPMPLEQLTQINITELWIGSGVTVGVLAALLLIFIVMKKSIGMALGFLAGALTGFSTLFQKVASLEIAAQSGLGIPYTAVWLAFFFLSFLSLQFAYRKNKILKIIPFFTAVKSLVPLIGGLLFFSERLGSIQWIGIGLIFLGIVVIAVRFSGGKAQENSVN